MGTMVCNAETFDKSVQSDVAKANLASAASGDYQQYLESTAFKNADKKISVPLKDFTVEKAEVSFENGAIDWKDGNGSITFNVNVPVSALYNIQIVWKPKKAGIDPNIGVKIDGKIPFSNASQIELKRNWKNVSESPRLDSSGNEYAQEQVETGEYITSVFQDYTGVVTEPYVFEFKKGSHTVALVNPEQDILIKEISLVPPVKTVNYDELCKEYDLKTNNADVITVQAENAKIKNSKSLIPKSNNSDAGMTPCNAYKSQINYIGGTSWQSPGSMMTWDFDVETAGYYYFGFRYKQSELINGVSWRKLKIDGQVPFNEASAFGFDFGTSWEYLTLGKSKKEPYYIWLDEGKHTVSLKLQQARKVNL